MKTTSRIPLRRSLAALVVAALLAVVLALAPSSSSPAQAQAQTDRTLVSNLGQSTEAARAVDVSPAVGFTTGPDSSKMSAAKLDFGTGTSSPANLFVELWSANGSAPGALITALAKPGNLSTSGIKTFSAPADTTLAANTTYFIVARFTTSTNVPQVRITTSNAEDNASLSGWSIGDVRVSGVGTWSVSSSAMKVAVEGSVGASNVLVGNVQNFKGTYHAYYANAVLHGNIVRQHFTTGPNAAGYRLSSITFPWLSASAPVEISLWRTDHDRQLPPTASYLGSLGGKASFLAYFNPPHGVINSTIEAGELTYALPSPVTLAANTEYQILIESHDYSQSNVIRWVTVPMTATRAEDADSAPGWSIADTSFRHGLVTVRIYGPVDEDGAPTTDETPYTYGYYDFQYWGWYEDSTRLSPYLLAFQLSGETLEATGQQGALLPEVTLTAAEAAGATEGAALEFTLTRSGPTEEALEVDLRVSETGEMLAVRPGRTLIPAGQDSATFSVLTLNDEASEADSVVTVAVAEIAERYSVVKPASASVTVMDDEPNTPATGAPSISGTAQAGETLTADTSGIADADGLDNARFSYQWLAGSADIGGANGARYTIHDTDAGQAIQVRVSFSDDADNLETLTSAATSAVEAAPSPTNPPAAPDRPTATAVFRGGVDLEWNEVARAESYAVQLYRNGQWIDLPGDGVEIAFYGAGAIISGLNHLEASYYFQVRAQNARGASDWSEYLMMQSTSEFPSGNRDRPGNIPATGAPTIGGTARVGETLSADTSGIADKNALDRVQFSYQWVSGEAAAASDIAGATASSYTLADADAGKTVKVRVSFTDRSGYRESLSSAATEAVLSSVQAAPNTAASGAPSINGAARVGETLTADTSGVADADGLDNATFSYQWLADGAEIAGATGSSYTPADADEGKTIKVSVSFIDDAGNQETLSSAATDAVSVAEPAEPPPAPANLTATVNADGSVTLAWGAPDDDSVSGYRILRRRPSEGENALLVYVEDTGSTTTFTDNDVTAGIQHVYRVKAVNAAGAGEQSNYVNVTTEEPRQPAQNAPATGAPGITGTVRVGETLTADTSGIADEDGVDNASFSYQWLADGADIQGATGSGYTLSASDQGKTITVKVSFTDDAGNEETLTSAATAAVEAAVAEEEPTEPPPAPTNLTAVVNADGSVTLAWDAPDDDSVTGYLILRRRPYEGEKALLVYVEDTGSTATTFTDTGVTAGTQHVYRVKAINEAGVGNQSNYVNVDP